MAIKMPSPIDRDWEAYKRYAEECMNPSILYPQLKSDPKPASYWLRSIDTHGLEIEFDLVHLSNAEKNNLFSVLYGGNTSNIITQKEKPTMTSRKADIKSRLAQLEKEFANLSRFPEDDFETGTVITFIVRGRSNRDGTEMDFTYAAVKGGLNPGDRNWYLTSTVKGRQVKTWDELCEFVGDGDMFTVLTFRNITSPEKNEDEVAETVAAGGTE